MQEIKVVIPEWILELEKIIEMVKKQKLQAQSKRHVAPATDF